MFCLCSIYVCLLIVRICSSMYPCLFLFDMFNVLIGATDNTGLITQIQEVNPTSVFYVQWYRVSSGMYRSLTLVSTNWSNDEHG